MTSLPQPRAVDRDEVRQQIDKIAGSSSFAGKTQLIRLLRILFENMDSTTLKPDRVIRELWPDEVKTKGSADVATEMNRLRKALDAYYASDGCGDTIIIRLPNRAPSANGAKENRWMVAEPRIPTQQTPAEAAVSHSPAHNGLRLWLMNTVLAALLLLIAGLFLAGLLKRDRQPHAARLEGSSLVIVNEEGEELWRKSFSSGFWPQYYEAGLVRRVWFGDLDGRKHYDVLFSYQAEPGPHSKSSELICYSDRGEEKWRWVPGRALPELQGDPATFEIVSFGVLQNQPGEQPRIVALGTHIPWSPTQVAMLDSSGRLLSEYWHSGHLYELTFADLDGDGKQEIIVDGISNGYREATMVVLDPDKITGASLEAARPELQIHGMGQPHERARLLFHRSDLNAALMPYNQALESTVEHGKIRVRTQECRLQQYCDIWYVFDNHFELTNVEPSDIFRSLHDESLESTVESGKVRISVQECQPHPYRVVKCGICLTATFTYFILEPSGVFRSAHDEYYRKDKNPHIFSVAEEANSKGPVPRRLQDRICSSRYSSIATIYQRVGTLMGDPTVFIYQMIADALSSTRPSGAALEISVSGGATSSPPTLIYSLDYLSRWLRILGRTDFIPIRYQLISELAESA